MKIASGLMNGLVFEAQMEGTQIKLETDELLSPDDAAFAEFEIVEATDEERAALRAAGYNLPSQGEAIEGPPING